MMGRKQVAPLRPILSERGPIRAIDYETLVARLGRSGQIPWLDRGRTDTAVLRTHGRIAIVGWMKSGKTREAAEPLPGLTEMRQLVEQAMKREDEHR